MDDYWCAGLAPLTSCGAKSSQDKEQLSKEQIALRVKLSREWIIPHEPVWSPYAK